MNTEQQTNFVAALQESLQEADAAFIDHIGTHWSRLERDEVQGYIADQDVDIIAKGFNPDNLQRGLKSQRELLLNMLEGVTDAQSFFEACRGYIDAESNRLAFVTNDLAQAHIGRDYFEQFLKSALPVLVSRGLVKEEESQEIQILLDYYDLHFEAYELLREEVSKMTEGQTRSLVIAGMSGADDVDMDKDPELVLDENLLNDDAKIKKILARTVPAYEAILEKYNIHVGPDDVPSPLLLWMGVQAKEIGMLEESRKVRPGMRLKEHRHHAKTALNRASEILRAVNDLTLEKGDLYGLISAKLMFEELRAQANHVPLEFPEMLDASLEAAKKTSLSKLGELRTATYQPMTMRVPDSNSSAKYLWSATGSPQRIRGECEELEGVLSRAFSHAASVPSLAHIAEKMLDSACEDIFFGMNEPTQILFIKEYIANTRRNLGERLMDSGHFDPQEFGALMRVEQKCDAYLESLRVMKEWMLEYTDSAYDHPFLACAMQYTAQTGRSLPDATKTAEWKEDIQPAAYGMFMDVLKGMGAHKKGYAHMLIPAIYGKAAQIATAEAGTGEPQFDGTKAEASYYERVGARTQQIFDEAIESIPQKDAFTGKKIKVHDMSAEEVLPVLEALDKRLKLLQTPPVGRA